MTGIQAFHPVVYLGARNDRVNDCLLGKYLGGFDANKLKSLLYRLRYIWFGDKVTASTLLRSARLTSGISQGDLAARTKTSQPDISIIEAGKRTPTVDTLERLLRQTGHRIIAVPGVGPDAIETAERISVALGRNSTDSALRAFLDYSDSLHLANGVDRVVLTVTEPHPTGSRAWDAALAALADYWLTKSKLPKPGWISAPGRTLQMAESPQLGKYDLEPDRANVPAEFLRRNVLVERSTLEST